MTRAIWTFSLRRASFLRHLYEFCTTCRNLFRISKKATSLPHPFYSPTATPSKKKSGGEKRQQISNWAQLTSSMALSARSAPLLGEQSSQSQPAAEHPIIKGLKQFTSGHVIEDTRAGTIYEVVRFIDRGGSCFCYEAVTRENQVRVAIKVFSVEALKLQQQQQKRMMDEEEDKRRRHVEFVASGRVVGAIQGPQSQQLQQLPLQFDIAREIHLLQSLEHPHILQAYAFFNDSAHVYIVLELCTGNNLHKLLAAVQEKRATLLPSPSSTVLLGGFSEARVRAYMRQLTAAVCHLHERNVVHRDLKLCNFLFTDETVSELRLADFGLAVAFAGPHDKLTQAGGTPSYVAPEVIAPDSFPLPDGTRGYGFPCDIWSLGICLFVMLFGCCPWRNSADRSLKHKLVKDPLVFPQLNQMPSAAALSLISAMLTKTPHKRPTIQQIRQHPWFSVRLAVV